MKEQANNNPQNRDDVQIFVNENVITVIVDGPGDTTVRPPRPVLRKLGLETQAKIAKWQAEEREAKEQQARESRPSEREPKK